MNLSKIILSIVLAFCTALPISLNAAPKNEPVDIATIPSLIEGSWNTNQKMSEQGIVTEVKLTYTFASESAVNMTSEIKINFPINESGYHNVLTFSLNFTAAGTYTLDADKLTVCFNEESIAVEYLPASAEIDDAVSQQMLPVIAQAIPEMEKVLRSSLTQPETYTVLSIAKNKMDLLTDDNHTLKFKRK